MGKKELNDFGGFDKTTTLTTWTFRTRESPETVTAEGKDWFTAREEACRLFAAKGVIVAPQDILTEPR